MTFSAHTAITVLVLRFVPFPFLVIPLCFGLHLLTDAIPHAEWQPWKQISRRVQLLMVIDFIVTIALVVGIFFTFSPLWLAFSALLSSLLPDLSDRLARRYALPFRKLHLSMHTWPESSKEPINWGKTVTGKTPTYVKILSQILIILLGFLGLYL